MRPRTVLILTHWFDPTADFVVEELNRRDVPVIRWDPGDFPQRLTLAATLGERWTGSLRTPDRTVALDDVGCVYYRRPTVFEFPAAMSEPERAWAAREARMGLGGVLATLPSWLNHPSNMAAAEYKPVQLAAATAVGLRTPDTLITNDPEQARMFADTHERVVCKPLAGSGIAEENTYRLVYSEVVTAADLDTSIGLTAHQFQAWVPKDHEVRLTVVDEHLLAARIDAQTPGAHLDWRTDYSALRYSITEVPATVRRGVLALMRRLGVRFGAFDFVVTPDDEWFFLELNPNGQWAWIEEETGLPIAASIADALTKE